MADVEAKITFKISTTGAAQAAKEIDKVKKAAETTDKPVSKLSTAMESLSKTTQKLSEVASKQSKLEKLFAAIQRVAIYRGIRAAIKDISQAIREGIMNLYKWSQVFEQTFDDSFASLEDRIATSALFVKNALGTAIAPLIETLTPVIETLADKVATLFDHIAEVASAAMGKDFYWSARKARKELSEYNKELRKTLLGFDEINRLNGESGKNEEDYSGMFARADISEQAREVGARWSEVADKVKEVVKGIYDTLNKYAPVIGIILALTGHLGLALGMLTVWAAKEYGETPVGSWSEVTEKISEQLSAILTAAGAAKLAIGLLLAFTGHIPQGIAAILTGGLMVGAANVDWTAAQTSIKETVAKITTIGAPLLAAIGAILLATGHIGFGIGFVLAGIAAFGVSVATINTSSLSTEVRNLISNVLAIGAGTMFLAGVALLLTGNVPLGAALIAGSAAGLFASALSSTREQPYGGGSGSGSGAGRNSMFKGGQVTGNINTGSWYTGASGKLAAPLYADGGFPEDGLFFANHNELVGRFTNGKTAVANNDEIVSGIAQANTGVENAVYAMANMVVQAIERKDTTVSLDGDKLSKAVSNRQNLAALARG